MKPLSNPRPGTLSRRAAVRRLCLLTTLPATGALLPACGGGGVAAPASLPPPAAPATAALRRLQAALQRAPLGVSASPVAVAERLGNSGGSSLGAGAVYYPPLDNPGELSLATVPQLWGHRRDAWTLQSGAVIAGRTVWPVTRPHPAATTGSASVCGLHFVFDGRAFEVWFAGWDAQITLVADGRTMAPGLIRTALEGGVAGAPLHGPEPVVRFDFGSAALRRISLYGAASRGPCMLVVGASDQLLPWDRSDEASMAAIADSYGQGLGPHWRGGPFWEAAALLGIPHLDLDAVGGTGYAPNNGADFTRDPGNAFPARLATSVDTRPDLFITAGGINDNNAYAAPPLYASAALARAGFEAAVRSHYQALRAALPDSVLVALGPWKPRQTVPTDAVEQSKADTVKRELQSAGGLWVFLDNLNGGWLNSAGASAPPEGPWQTGTGNSAAPAGDGNGDLYLGADGTHPNEAGCLYLGTRIATDLRAALLAL